MDVKITHVSELRQRMVREANHAMRGETCWTMCEGRTVVKFFELRGTWSTPGFDDKKSAAF